MEIEEYRKQDMINIINKMDTDVRKYTLLMEKKKRLGKFCTKLDLIVTAFGIVITLVFSLLGSNDIIPPKTTIIIMESLFTAGASVLLLISRYGKLQNKKYYIYEKIKNFCVESLNNFKLIYSRVLEDNLITMEEYESVINFKNDYDHSKIQLKSELGNGYTKIEK